MRNHPSALCGDLKSVTHRICTTTRWCYVNGTHSVLYVGTPWVFVSGAVPKKEPEIDKSTWHMAVGPWGFSKESFEGRNSLFG